MVPVGTMGSSWPGVSPFRAVVNLICCVQGRELRALRASFSGVYPARGLQWRFNSGFGFRYGLWLPFVAGFAVLGSGGAGLLMIPVGTMAYGFFLTWGWPFQGCGGACGLCPKSRDRCTRLVFRSYPAGKVQRHFTFGFDFRHSLWLPFVAGFAVLKGSKERRRKFKRSLRFYHARMSALTSASVLTF